jgi:hypothetical protein
MPDEKLPLGQHRFQLEVVDDSGNLSQPALITVIVVDTIAPTAILDLRDASGRVITDGQVNYGENFILNGSRSTDIGGSIVGYTWSKIDSPTWTITTSSSSLTVNEVLPYGSHMFELIVEDNSGNLSSPATIFVDVL